MKGLVGATPGASCCYTFSCSLFHSSAEEGIANKAAMYIYPGLEAVYVGQRRHTGRGDPGVDVLIPTIPIISLHQALKAPQSFICCQDCQLILIKPQTHL